MKNVTMIQLDDDERKILVAMMATATSFLASIFGEPFDEIDARIVDYLIKRQPEVLTLSLKLNLDKIAENPDQFREFFDKE